MSISIFKSISGYFSWLTQTCEQSSLFKQYAARIPNLSLALRVSIIGGGVLLVAATAYGLCKAYSWVYRNPTNGDGGSGDVPPPVKQTEPAPVKQTEPAPVKQTEPAPVKQTEPSPTPVKTSILTKIPTKKTVDGTGEKDESGNIPPSVPVKEPRPVNLPATSSVPKTPEQPTTLAVTPPPSSGQASPPVAPPVSETPEQTTTLVAAPFLPSDVEARTMGAFKNTIVAPVTGQGSEPSPTDKDSVPGFGTLFKQFKQLKEFKEETPKNPSTLGVREENTLKLHKRSEAARKRATNVLQVLDGTKSEAANPPPTNKDSSEEEEEFSSLGGEGVNTDNMMELFVDMSNHSKEEKTKLDANFQSLRQEVKQLFLKNGTSWSKDLFKNKLIELENAGFEKLTFDLDRATSEERAKLLEENSILRMLIGLYFAIKEKWEYNRKENRWIIPKNPKKNSSSMFMLPYTPEGKLKTIYNEFIRRLPNFYRNDTLNPAQKQILKQMSLQDMVDSFYEGKAEELQPRSLYVYAPMIMNV